MSFSRPVTYATHHFILAGIMGINVNRSCTKIEMGSDVALCGCIFWVDLYWKIGRALEPLGLTKSLSQ